MLQELPVNRIDDIRNDHSHQVLATLKSREVVWLDVRIDSASAMRALRGESTWTEFYELLEVGHSGAEVCV